MQRNLLLSLLIWLLEIILVASFVSDRWTREIQAAEDQMLIAYFGVEKVTEIRQTSQKWFNRLFAEPASGRVSTANSFRPSASGNYRKGLKTLAAMICFLLSKAGWMCLWIHCTK